MVLLVTLMKQNQTNLYEGWTFVPPGRLSRWFKMKDWLWENNITSYVTNMDGFLFEREQDALLFKLKWC